MSLPERSVDGCYHPATEAELCALVAEAHRNGWQLRVMGSSHSVWRAIVTDHFDGPRTPAGEVAVVLDRYTRVFEAREDPARPGEKLVEVQAGCHVGISPRRPAQARVIEQPADSDIYEPSPWHDGSWEKSLTSILHHRDGLALPDLGGISHQTVAGFLSTGSAGGTVKWSVHEAIVALRVIDGTGQAKTLTIDGDDPDWFRAAGVGLGLCGVISTVTFRVVPTFDVVGREAASTVMKSPDCDFYANRPHERLPSLEQFLLDTDYVRIMWWPQYDFDRLVTWQATRAPFEPRRDIEPYREIARFPIASQVGISVIYTLMAYMEDPSRALGELTRLRKAVRRGEHPGLVEWLRKWAPPPDPAQPYPPQEKNPWLSAFLEFLKGDRHSPVTLGAAWIRLVELFVTGTDEVLATVVQLPFFSPLMRALGQLIPANISTLYALFIETGPGGAPKVQHFADRGFLGLPMDNQMDDIILPTWFTELWVPFTPGDGRVQQTIATLRKHFDADGTPQGAYEATGAFAFELYAGRKDETFFLSPATGQHVFRVDAFWFAKNPADPVTTFFPKLWNVLEPLGFRLHWGKFLPQPNSSNPLTARYPEWLRWKAVRERVDPANVFLTSYWKQHLGL